MAFLLPLISAFIPGAAPYVAAAATLFRGGGGGGGTQAIPPGPPPPPPPDPLVLYGPPIADPTQGRVTPVGFEGGGAFTSAPFVGDAPPDAGGPVPTTGAGTIFDPFPGFGADVPTEPVASPGVDIGGIIRGLVTPGGLLAMGAGTALAGAGIGAARVGGAIAGVASVVPRWIGAVAGGAALATSIYELYRRLRGSGHTHKRARRLALMAHGVHLRRRRMRVTNVHALRRAIRRVHGFQRVARKVGALHVGARRLLPGRTHRRRHYRRGDLNPFLVEDTADLMDEAEDLGVDGGQFRDSAEAGD
jgi:hypothetical protein